MIAYYFEDNRRRTMGTRHIPLAALCAALAAAGCYDSSTRLGGGDAREAAPDPDANETLPVDAQDTPPTEAVDARIDGGTDGSRPDPLVDPGDRCRPQEAYEDPSIDCDGCDPCPGTPYMWTGSMCEFKPICCMCAGADCDHLFATLEACNAAYRDCPRAPGRPPLYPEARLLWQAPGGVAGTGPMLLVDGAGLARSWVNDRGNYNTDDPGWSRTDYDAAEQLGAEAANDLFERLTNIDYTNLPHPPAVWSECYPLFELAPCPTCERIRIEYSRGRDLNPEFWGIYNWMQERLCRIIPHDALPISYCEW
jgi:hypothetical protein